jgi:hypothetical protein
MDEAIAENLERHIKAHPEVVFMGFLPPYPTSWFGLLSEREKGSQLGFRHRMYELAAKYPHFHLYDFALTESVVNDPARYKDFNHYDQATNLEMANVMMAQDNEAASDPVAANKALFEIADRFEWARWTTCDEMPAPRLPDDSAPQTIASDGADGD